MSVCSVDNIFVSHLCFYIAHNYVFLGTSVLRVGVGGEMRVCSYAHAHIEVSNKIRDTPDTVKVCLLLLGEKGILSQSRMQFCFELGEG